MPFPDEIKTNEPKVSFETAKIVKKLLKEGKLSPRVIGAISPVLNDITGYKD